ncbi:Uncharacterised protein [Bordetella ansorpii]|uniref:Uncharacterized protein n=1 Tax=Bordetella ansorpii TaxID=288768 RepID=A0A157Q088_9BORD|nr:hypothetical protein [Bordetella ansorpii]SAI39253.1 Uncharacterised protein [Bordetella ansorpii]
MAYPQIADVPMADSFNAFKNLIRSHAQRQQEAPQSFIDWEARRQWWVSQVDCLLVRIRAWLGSLVDEKIVGFTQLTTELDEPYLGKYVIHKAQIDCAGRSMTIVPVASIVLGGFGRIDVSGPAGRVTLILAAPDNTLPGRHPWEGATWLMTHSQDPSSLTSLDEALFHQIFVDLFEIGDGL